MKKIIWISQRVPYDKVPHAGGQIHNYYLKYLHAQDKYDIRLVSFYKNDESSKIDLEEYGINNDLICLKKDLWGVVRKLSNYNPLNKYANFTSCFINRSIISVLNGYKEKGFVPDIIILQWTQIILHLSAVKRIFPNAKIISIEEDVSFQKYERRKNAAQGIIKENIWFRRYEELKRLELECLSKSDLVIVNNSKDKNLLIRNKLLSNIWCWCPYYQTMIDVERSVTNKDILFYGAMNREENWRSAIWFIEKVFNSIRDKDIRFVIIGNRPPKALRKYEDERIKVLGFVEDVKPLFRESLCMVAPLVLGAGVKIKVIEGLSAGIPILTNKIGIEGIPAENGKEYLFCETPDDYLTAINRLIEDGDLRHRISNNAKAFIQRNYNYDLSAKEFVSVIEKL